MNQTTNIMISGVGGQGSLLASRILGNAVMSLGFDVKVSEVHGMSQRGGSVVTYVKYGKVVASPVICKGEADFLLSFEQLECARWLPYLKIGGTVVTSTQKINPMPVIIGAAEYPTGIIESIEQKKIKLFHADALGVAKLCGTDKAANVVLIGMLAAHMDIDKKVFLNAVETSVPVKFKELNLAAFEAGYQLKVN
jgi:Pyruvate:ferredoxin oxidoreductase and related 2-oxoacid:ferredoxin oxidoreductases, gamma subunit